MIILISSSSDPKVGKVCLYLYLIGLMATDNLAEMEEMRSSKATFAITVDPEVAILRKELSDMRSTSAAFAITVKPDKKVACTWTTTIDTATVDEMKKVLFEEFPQYSHDDFAEVFVYTGFSKPDHVHDDQHLRNILRLCKLNFRCRMTISLESPSKGFSAWSFNDVCIEYNLSNVVNPAISVLPSFTDVQPAPWNPDLHTEALDNLETEVHTRVCSMDLPGSNEPTRSFVVSSFLLATTTLFKEDLFLASQRDLSGRRGHGPVDFSVHSRKNQDFTLGVTEVKKEDIRQGVAQNIVQLEATLTSKKRKREIFDTEGEEGPACKMRSYGIITDSKEWYFLECTLDENEAVSYRMKRVPAYVDFDVQWREGEKVSTTSIKTVFLHLVWLFKRMTDELPGRESRSPSLPTSKKRTAINKVTANDNPSEV